MQLNIGCFPMAPMTDPKPAYLRITLLEDPSAPPHVAAALQGIVPEAMVIRVAGETALARALDEFAPDVVLCHEPLTTFSAREALAVTQARRPETPLLIVAPAFNESTLETLKAGAADFVTTANLPRLAGAIDAALKEREALRRLSQRQRQVLQLIAAGHSTRDVARRLRLSVKTVETHRAQVMKRLDIHDLASLVRFAVSVGIVSAALSR